MDDYYMFTYFLNLKNVSKSMAANEQTRMFTFIKIHFSGDIDYIDV
jgi:hypothetical protein